MQLSNEYVSEHGVLYKQLDGKNLLVVPEVMPQSLIQDIHRRGHFGVRKMKAEFIKQFFVKDFDRRAQLCMMNCVNCLMVDRKAGKGKGDCDSYPSGSKLWTRGIWIILDRSLSRRNSTSTYSPWWMRFPVVDAIDTTPFQVMFGVEMRAQSDDSVSVVIEGGVTRRIKKGHWKCGA